jgi:ABC-type arginine transport system permease subunit
MTRRVELVALPPLMNQYSARHQSAAYINVIGFLRRRMTAAAAAADSVASSDRTVQTAHRADRWTDGQTI